jgi:hypothetical protein
LWTSGRYQIATIQRLQEGRRNTLAYDKDITALLVVDPYNDFISEGGKIWPRIKAVAEANNCVAHMLEGSQRRAPGKAPGLLCNASSLPAG